MGPKEFICIKKEEYEILSLKKMLSTQIIMIHLVKML